MPAPTLVSRTDPLTVGALISTVLAHITTPTRTGDTWSFEYLGRTIDGTVAESIDLLSECLYLTRHAKTVDVFDDDQAKRAIADHPSTRSALSARLDELFAARTFAVRVPGRCTAEGRFVLIHRGLTLHCGPERIVGGDDDSGYEMLVEHYSAAVSPGFFYVYGPGTLDRQSHYSERTYIAVTEADAVVELAPVLVAALDALGLGYNVKFLTDERSYPRTDTVTVYHDCAEQVNSAIESVLATSATVTGPVSDYCVSVAPGVGRAQEPVGRYAGTRSFGQHRSRLLAEAALRILTDGEDPVATGSRLAHEYRVDSTCIALNRS